MFKNILSDSLYKGNYKYNIIHLVSFPDPPLFCPQEIKKMGRTKLTYIRIDQIVTAKLVPLKSCPSGPVLVARNGPWEQF